MSYDLTNAVLLRPQMYTATGSFLEVIAFLEGYYSGLARDPRAKAQVERWSNFHQFIEAQQGNQNPDVWIVFHKYYKDDALQVFRRFRNKKYPMKSLEPLQKLWKLDIYFFAMALELCMMNFAVCKS